MDAIHLCVHWLVAVGRLVLAVFVPPSMLFPLLDELGREFSTKVIRGAIPWKKKGTAMFINGRKLLPAHWVGSLVGDGGGFCVPFPFAVPIHPLANDD